MIEINLTQKRGSAKEHALTIQERKILEEKLNLIDKIIYILGAFGGLRVEEISQTRLSWLEWADFGTARVLSINIPNEDTNILNKYKSFKTKTRDSRTTYIFNLELANTLYTYYQINPDGLQMTRQAIHKRVKNWNKLLNRQNNTIHPHALRSTAQNMWKFELNFDDVFIQLCFGWKDANTLVRHYRTMNKASGQSYLIQKYQKGL